MNDQNSNPKSMPRSPLLMNRDDSAVLVVDVQEKLVPHIAQHQRIVWNIGRLIEGANALNVKVAATEQYPKGLGSTVPELTKLIGEQCPTKTMFSCRECETIFEDLKQRNIHNVVVAGIEAHVCVAQTVLDLISAGFCVFICVDAIGSRFSIDCLTAIRRMENNGAVPVTTESVLFEWCEKAGSPEFKTISKIVQQQGPPSA